MEHSPTSVTGNGWERTPWRVVQTAAGRVIYTPHQDARGGFYPFAGQAYWGGS